MKTSRYIIALCASIFTAQAEVAEYRVNGETRLYDTDCYWNAPEKTAPSPDGGGYNVVVPTTREECRVRGEFARVDVYVYDFLFREAIHFKGKWLSPEHAATYKAEQDAIFTAECTRGSKRQCGATEANPTVNRVEIVRRSF
jgi:hypothetical protein